MCELEIIAEIGFTVRTVGIAFAVAWALTILFKSM